jgi:hypothetical protein
MLSVLQLLHDCPKGLLFQAKSWNKLGILERQKMLQAGQVFFRRLSVDFALVLPFSAGSISIFDRGSMRVRFI